MSKALIVAALSLSILGARESGTTQTARRPINDTGQASCYDDSRETRCPDRGSPFFGQDAQYGTNSMSFRDNGDGTISDLGTGLMWVGAQGDKVSWKDAVAGATSFELAGRDDWRLPSIKELYSLIDFSGSFGRDAGSSTPYIDIEYFGFAYGDESRGERFIDVQYWSATEYVGTTMGGDHTVFGVNFADGRIKGYPSHRRGGEPVRAHVKYVRGPTGYGVNDVRDGGDGTVSDGTTGLVWQKGDSGRPGDWQEALAYCEQLELAGNADWRLPDVKELQSIVDYSRAPDVTGTPAIDPVFEVSDPELYYWSSTTALEGPPSRRGGSAAYVSFGRAMGFMQAPPRSGRYRLLDVHGAGAQRADPKSGDPDDYPRGHGPQGDVVNILNLARCVRGPAQG